MREPFKNIDFQASTLLRILNLKILSGALEARYKVEDITWYPEEIACVTSWHWAHGSEAVVMCNCQVDRSDQTRTVLRRSQAQAQAKSWGQEGAYPTRKGRWIQRGRQSARNGGGLEEQIKSCRESGRRKAVSVPEQIEQGQFREFLDEDQSGEEDFVDVILSF